MPRIGLYAHQRGLGRRRGQLRLSDRLPLLPLIAKSRGPRCGAPNAGAVAQRRPRLRADQPDVLFGHHFAAIAGAGPLVGPVLAAQMGYLPGMLWILAGVVFAGAVQDFMVLFLSPRRDGARSAT